jgi:hypothetical protein
MSSEAVQRGLSSGIVATVVNGMHGNAFKGAGLDKLLASLSLDSKYKEAIGSYAQEILKS